MPPLSNFQARVGRSSPSSARADDEPADWRFALAAGAIVILLVLAAMAIGKTLPAALTCNGDPGCSKAGADWLAPFFVWDAGWYEDIATHGYAWADTKVGYQNPAFWPLWPLVLRVLHTAAPAPGAYRPVVVCVTIALALSSAAVFNRLACACASRPVARRATILYLVFPGMHYLLRSYPTGLLNIGVCLVLLMLVRRRPWLASLLSGVLIAAGPLALSASATVASAAALASWRRLLAPGARGTALAKPVVMAALSFAGLLAFMAYLQIRFGHPLLFMSAEGAWGRPQTVSTRLARWLQWEAVLPDIRLAFRHVRDMYGAATARGAVDAFQLRLNAFGLGTALASLYVGWRRLPWTVALQAWLALALYVWFIATLQGHEATLRLIYIAPGCFIGLAYVLRRANILFGVVVCISLLLLLADAAASAAGFWIV